MAGCACVLRGRNADARPLLVRVCIVRCSICDVVSRFSACLYLAIRHQYTSVNPPMV